MSAPASTCGYCSREGIVSEDQRTFHDARGHGGHLNTRLRFYCTCGNIWLANREEAELQGRFLDRAGLR